MSRPSLERRLDVIEKRRLAASPILGPQLEEAERRIDALARKVARLRASVTILLARIAQAEAAVSVDRPIMPEIDEATAARIVAAFTDGKDFC